MSKTTQLTAIDKINALKKSKFVEAYNQTIGNITDSASIAGINRATYYLWLEKDKDFAMQILDSEANLNDDIRQALIQKAAEGDMTAIIFYLKNRHPDFKQQSSYGMEFKDGEKSIRFVVSRGNE